MLTKEDKKWLVSLVKQAVWIIGYCMAPIYFREHEARYAKLLDDLREE